MSGPEDPRRFSDPASDASSPLRRLLESARADDPTPAQLSQLSARLESMLAPSPAPSAGGAGHAGAWVPKLVALAIAAGAAGAWWMLRPEAQTPSPGAETSRAAPPASAVPLAPAAPVDAPIAAPASAAPPAEPRVRPPPPGPRFAPPAPVENVAEELQALDRAYAGMRAEDPAAALAAASEHERDFPAGRFVQEREVLAIEALARLGRGREARDRGERFRLAFPASAHQLRLDALLSDAGD